MQLLSIQYDTENEEPSLFLGITLGFIRVLFKNVTATKDQQFFL